MQLFHFNPFRSMTLRGTVLAAAGYAWAHVDPTSAATPLGATLLQVAGVVLGMVGVRNAIAKNGSGR